MLTVNDWLYAKASQFSQSTTINSFHRQSKRAMKTRINICLSVRVCMLVFTNCLRFINFSAADDDDDENKRRKYGISVRVLRRKKETKQKKTHISGSCVNLNVQLLGSWGRETQRRRECYIGIFWALLSTWFGNGDTTRHDTFTMKMAIFKEPSHPKKKISNVAKNSRDRRACWILIKTTKRG